MLLVQLRTSDPIALSLEDQLQPAKYAASTLKMQPILLRSEKLCLDREEKTPCTSRLLIHLLSLHQPQ